MGWSFYYNRRRGAHIWEKAASAHHCMLVRTQMEQFNRFLLISRDEFSHTAPTWYRCAYHRWMSRLQHLVSLKGCGLCHMTMQFRARVKEVTPWVTPNQGCKLPVPTSPNQDAQWYRATKLYEICYIFLAINIDWCDMTAHQAHHHESILSRSIHFDPFRPSGWGWSTKRPQREQILPKGLTLKKNKICFLNHNDFSCFQRPCKDQKSNASWHSYMIILASLQCRHRWQLVQSHDWCCVGLGAEPTNWEARLRECAQFGSPALRGKAMQGSSFKNYPLFPSKNLLFFHL